MINVGGQFRTTAVCYLRRGRVFRAGTRLCG